MDRFRTVYIDNKLSMAFRDCLQNINDYMHENKTNMVI